MTSYYNEDVKHDEKQKMFYIPLKNSDKQAILQYEKTEQTYELWHTEVPEECRGQGVAGVLATKAIQDLAKIPQSKIILTCSYLQNFYKKKQLEKFQQFDNIQV